jgi:hypothetical protein
MPVLMKSLLITTDKNTQGCGLIFKEGYRCLCLSQKIEVKA